MGENQKNDPFETPPREKIPGITARHVGHLLKTDDESAWVRAGMRHLIVRTKGRKSGKEHTVALPYWCDTDGTRIVVASYAGGPKHPAWYHNLADKTANPKIWIKDRAEEAWVEAQVLDGDEYRETWDRLVKDRAYYAEYQALTERRLPLIRLPARAA